MHYNVKRNVVLGKWIVLSGAEQYFSRNPTELSNIFLGNINDILSSFPSGILAERTLSFQYNLDNTSRLLFLFPKVSIFCGHQLRNYFVNQVTSMNILAAHGT